MWGISLGAPNGCVQPGLDSLLLLEILARELPWLGHCAAILGAISGVSWAGWSCSPEQLGQPGSGK